MSDVGRTAVITGVGRGIGLALLEEMVKDGWFVWGTVRDINAPVLANLDPSLHARIKILQLDTSDSAACAGLASQIDGPVDVLINSAASFAGEAFTADSFNPKAMADAFATNVIGPAVIARALKPQLLQGRLRGIVMMSTGNASLAGNTAGQMFAYRASKSALNQVVRSLAAEWGPEGLTTVALNPGWVQTQMGGPNATLPVLTAANNILSFVRTLTPEMNGGFLNTDGTALPW